MRTIYGLLLTAVICGIVVGEDKVPETHYKRTVADELVSRTNQNLTLWHIQNPNTPFLLLSSFPGFPNKIVLQITLLADKDQPSAVQMDVLERYLSANLQEILLSMEYTKQPIPEYLQNYLDRINRYIKDETLSEKLLDNELFQYFPFELVRM